MTSASGSDVETCIAWAVTLLRTGSPVEAGVEAQRGLAQWPASAPLWTTLAAAQILAGDLVGGYRAAKRALDIDPDCPGAADNAAAAVEGLREAYRSALNRLATPQDEAARLEAAYQAVSAADDAGVLEDAAAGVSLGLFLRLAAVEEADRRWPFAKIGRELAARDEHRHLIHQLPRVREDADRRELLDQHRAWGQAAEARAAADPVRPAPRGARTKPRVGLMSSDLRIHAVGAFADPLIGHAAELGVELFCYSAFPGPADGFQQYVADQATMRHLPGAPAIDMARAIAADALDVLVEVGGSTNDNRIEAMAHRLAPTQISWLGYPHSSGLGAIDRLVVDPFTAPTEPGLILEQPMVMPHTWIALSRGYFRDDIPLVRDLPQDRKGHVTFGTSGSPYKYSAATLDAWARVVSAVPGSHFLFIRPEGGSLTFRWNVTEVFARHGVSAERLDFVPVRGAHLPVYEEIDISLDTFPLTGGTTTCESLWMGAPVVTLAGKSVYERISHSLLNNCGLADLSTTSVEAFVARAVDLAADRERLRDWRANGRAAIMDGPLGDQRQFADDFFRLATTAL